VLHVIDEKNRLQIVSGTQALAHYELEEFLTSKNFIDLRNLAKEFQHKKPKFFEDHNKYLAVNLQLRTAVFIDS